MAESFGVLLPPKTKTQDQHGFLAVHLSVLDLGFSY